MRKKIARSLYEKASAERDAFIDERKLDARKSWPWDKLSKRNIDYWKGVSFQTLSLITQKIERKKNPYASGAGSTDEERAWEEAKQEILSLLKE